VIGRKKKRGDRIHTILSLSHHRQTASEDLLKDIAWKIDLLLAHSQDTKKEATEAKEIAAETREEVRRHKLEDHAH